MFGSCHSFKWLLWLENRFSLFFLSGIDINTTHEGLMSSFRVTFSGLDEDSFCKALLEFDTTTKPSRPVSFTHSMSCAVLSVWYISVNPKQWNLDKTHKESRKFVIKIYFSTLSVNYQIKEIPSSSWRLLLRVNILVYRSPSQSVSLYSCTYVGYWYGLGIS